MKHFFTKTFWAERDMELMLGKLLRKGVVLSCIITLFGGVLYLIQRKGESPNYSPVPKGQPFEGVEPYLRELSTIVPRIFDFDGAAIIQLGVCVLIATPILRVAFSVLSFLIEKNYLYVFISALVLTIIIANMLLGLH